MAKRKRKRKVSAFNRRVGAARKRGLTFKQAVRAAKSGRTTRKRKVVKARRRISTMARRRTRRRSRSRGFGGLGLGRLGSFARNVGLGAAAGIGIATVAGQLGAQFNQPILSQNANLIGAFTAFTVGGGLPGVVAALPQLGGVLPGAGGAAPSAGVGPFV